MVCDLLGIRGIAAGVRHGSNNERSALLEVWIHGEDEARAMEFVKSFQAEASKQPLQNVITWPWQCAHCGERVEPQFQACWQCGTERPSDT